MSADIYITYENDCLSRAEVLARTLHLTLTPIEELSNCLALVVTPERLELRAFEKSSPGAVYVDFLSDKLAYRTQYQAQKELIVKALGVKNNLKPTVLDATAGLGQDAYVMAALGYDVTMLERSPIIAALLQDGLRRAKNDEGFRQLKLNFIEQDASDFLKSCENKFDVIYLDPMFPERKKSAKVKKEMQLLQRILHDDNSDAEQLFLLAIKSASKRVVVKRPRLAPFLNEHKPDWQIKGKAARFDVYAC